MSRTLVALIVLALAGGLAAQTPAPAPPAAGAETKPAETPAAATQPIAPSDTKPAEPKGTIVIAAWDVVPHQIIHKPFTTGVVAFHEKPAGVVFAVVQPPLPAEARAKFLELAARPDNKDLDLSLTVDGGVSLACNEAGNLKQPITGNIHVVFSAKKKAADQPAEVLLDATIRQVEIVGQPRRNDRTGVWEFYTTIDPASLDDGPLEVYAFPYVAGAALDDQNDESLRQWIGQPLPLYANAKGTLKFNPPVWADCDKGDDASGDGTEAKPVKTIAAALKKAGDGGTVYLKAGKGYSAQALGGGKKRQYWTTIAAAPGVARDDVEIGPGRPGCDKLKFKGVTLYTDPPDRKFNTILAGENGETMVWLDDCKMYNKKGRWAGGGNAFGNKYEAYVTGGLTTEMDNGPGAVLLRNHKIHKITSDALTSARTAINVEVRDIDPGKTGAHPDWHQSYTGGDDKYKTCIIYNCSGFDCKSQGFFGHNLKDSAFVNCIFQRPPGIGASQYSGHMVHVLWIYCTVPTQSWLWRGTLHGENCHVLNGVFANMSETQGGNTGGFVIDSNHFIGGKPMGNQATTGDVQFVDPEKMDFHVKASSPAFRSGAPLQCVPADIDGRPRDREHPTRGCYESPAAADK